MQLRLNYPSSTSYWSSKTLLYLFCICVAGLVSRDCTQWLVPADHPSQGTGLLGLRGQLPHPHAHCRHTHQTCVPEPSQRPRGCYYLVIIFPMNSLLSLVDSIFQWWNYYVTLQSTRVNESQSMQFVRSRKKFSTTYAIVLFFFVFFFSRPFHENFKFLKNCPYDFHKILQSHSTPKGAPACAKASKSYGLDVRNIAKFSPKMAKKQPFFDFFRFSQKLSIRFERNFLQLFYTILESYMCNGIKIVWLGC